jgi:hypothetical protein
MRRQSCTGGAGGSRTHEIKTEDAGWRQSAPILTIAIVASIGSGVGVLVTAMQRPPAFERKVLAPSLPEAPFDLRIFTGAVKTDSRGEIIDGPDTDPVKKLVGAEAAGPRAGMERFTKSCSGRATSMAVPTRARASIRTTRS